MNVNIGLTLVLGVAGCVHKVWIRVCVCVRVCGRARDRHSRGVNREEFIGLMQRMIRREGRGLCFDRVTAAGGGGVCCCFRAHAQNSTFS